jgi:hypothetical protein
MHKSTNPVIECLLFAYFPLIHPFQSVTLDILFILVECVLNLANIRAIKFPSSLKATIPYKQFSALFSADVRVRINGLTATR